MVMMTAMMMMMKNVVKDKQSANPVQTRSIIVERPSFKQKSKRIEIFTGQRERTNHGMSNASSDRYNRSQREREKERE